MPRKLVTLAAALLLMAGCAGQVSETEAVTNNGSSADGSTTEVIVVEMPQEETVSEEEVVQEPEEEVKDDRPKAPLTGLSVEPEFLELRPAVVMLDNHYGARPQAGLAEADHIYEILAEGRITRYMAVFQSGSPSTVGPVRSARPYFIDKALEYDPYYVHVGGSMQAMTDIINLSMADVDGLSSGSNVFWRMSHKRIPHNMYSSLEAIRKESQRRKYRVSGSFEAPIFNEEPVEPAGESCVYLKAVYKKPTSSDSVGYFIEFEYNPETGRYDRSVNGKPHVDENSKLRLGAENILVQIASHKVIDKEGRRAISLIGEGRGYFLSLGKKQEVTWKKSGRYARTVFYDMNGDEIHFNPGQTWFQVVESDNTLGW